MSRKSGYTYILVLGSLFFCGAQAGAQNYAAPLPGQNVLAGDTKSQATPAYKRLPISLQDASSRLEELRNLMPNCQAKQFQEEINAYLEWLSDMADGHWRLHQSFSKMDGLKVQAEKEKQSTLKLGQLKRQAMLLKAEFLIRENRQAEALGPLVEIVVAEPKTATGENAYGLLKMIGFTEETAANDSEPKAQAPEAQTKPATAPAKVAVKSPPKTSRRH